LISVHYNASNTLDIITGTAREKKYINRLFIILPEKNETKKYQKRRKISEKIVRSEKRNIAKFRFGNVEKHCVIVWILVENVLLALSWMGGCGRMGNDSGDFLGKHSRKLQG
jgi:hypothetical protein